MTASELAKAISRATGYNKEDLSILPQSTLEKWYMEVTGQKNRGD